MLFGTYYKCRLCGIFCDDGDLVNCICLDCIDKLDEDSEDRQFITVRVNEQIEMQDN